MSLFCFTTKNLVHYVWFFTQVSFENKINHLVTVAIKVSLCLKFRPLKKLLITYRVLNSTVFLLSAYFSDIYVLNDKAALY